MSSIKNEKIKDVENKNVFNKFTKAIKKYFLKDTTKTILLVIIIIALYFLINWGVQKINLAQIDFTKDKLFTLSDTSKNAVKDLKHDTTIYAWQYSEDSSMVDLLRQYNKENEKIEFQVITKDKNPELVEEYYLDEKYPELIVKSDIKTKYVYSEETYTYDENSDYIDITEQKLTNAILDVNMEKQPVVYFLEGKSNYSLSSNMIYLGEFLKNELYDVQSLNLVSTGEVPENCDILAIMSLTTDLTETEVTGITNYINRGGNLIIAKDIRISDFKDFPNFQKILDLYGISLPNKYVVETDNYSVAGAAGYIQGNVAIDNEITRLIYNSKMYPLLYYPGVIEIKNDSELGELKTTINKIVKSSSNAKAVNVQTKEEENGQFSMGLVAEKIVSDGVISNLVVFSSAVSFSDAVDTSIGLNTPMVGLDANSNLIMNSFAYLSSRGELYSIRKSTSTTQYIPTEAQDRYVRIAISCIPVVIIVLGFVVWRNRRKNRDK